MIVRATLDDAVSRELASRTEPSTIWCARRHVCYTAHDDVVGAGMRPQRHRSDPRGLRTLLGGPS